MIKLENVTKEYPGGTTALKNASADIAKGEFVFLVGASGSGKSTFLRLLNKQEDPSEGRIFVAGKDVSKLSSWKVPLLRRNIGCIFQDFKLLPNKTVGENVSFALEVIGRPRHVIKNQVPAICDLVGLGEMVDKYPEQLSGGEQQRVSIARAFVNRPLILLADEPTGNLPDRDRHHAVARSDQQDGHHGGHGHPRSRHRRHHASPRHRTLGRGDRARSGPRRLRVAHSPNKDGARHGPTY